MKGIIILQGIYATALTYNVNPIVFAVIYLGTLFPCWFGIYKIGSSIKNKNKESFWFWVIAEFILLMAPYIYVILWGKNFPRWFWILLLSVLVLSLIEGFIQINKKLKNENKSTIFWDLYSFFYDGINFSIPYQNLLERLINELDLVENKKILDIGCGSGNLEKHIIQKKISNIEIYAIDFSGGMIKKAIKKCQGHPYIKYKTVDLSGKLPFSDNYFDNVVTNNVLYAIKDKKELMNEIYRVTKPGGKLVISDPKPNSHIRMIIREHLKLISKMPLIEKSWNYIKFIITLPIMGIPPILLSLLVINKREQKNLYTFSSKEDLLKLFSRYNDVKLYSVDAEQSWLVTGNKE